MISGATSCTFTKQTSKTHHIKETPSYFRVPFMSVKHLLYEPQVTRGIRIVSDLLGYGASEQIVER